MFPLHFAGWVDPIGPQSTKLLPGDPPAYCDAAGAALAGPGEVPLPSFAWRWLGDWRPTLPDPVTAGGGQGAETDPDGWVYALGFGSDDFAPRARLADCVRKRTLYRRRWLSADLQNDPPPPEPEP